MDRQVDNNKVMYNMNGLIDKDGFFTFPLRVALCGIYNVDYIHQLYNKQIKSA